MEQGKLAMHETLEVHELLMFKNVCLSKSKMMQTMTADENLRLILQKDAEAAAAHIHDLQGILAIHNGKESARQ